LTSLRRARGWQRDYFGKSRYECVVFLEARKRVVNIAGHRHLTLPSCWKKNFLAVSAFARSDLDDMVFTYVCRAIWYFQGQMVLGTRDNAKKVKVTPGRRQYCFILPAEDSNTGVWGMPDQPFRNRDQHEPHHQGAALHSCLAKEEPFSSAMTPQAAGIAMGVMHAWVPTCPKSSLNHGHWFRTAAARPSCSDPIAAKVHMRELELLG
jgi:hypothetical protein